MRPRTASIRQDDTHRLIPFRAGPNVLARLAASEAELEDLDELESATNDRCQAEAGMLPGISVHELLFGVSYAHIVNAAFTHTHPAGSRFNSPERGAWYAAFDLETAQAEVSFHKSQELAEIGWREPETFRFDDYLADFRAEFHDLRADRRYVGCLDPNSYAKSQKLARELLAAGSAGILYPSVRHHGGTCIVCFRPALVGDVRKGQAVTIAFKDARPTPIFRQARSGR